MNDLIRAIITPILPAFFAEGVSRIYVAECCDRVLISKTLPTRCGTCNKAAASESVLTEPYTKPEARPVGNLRDTAEK